MHVIRRAFRPNLMNEPETLLCKRQRQRLFPISVLYYVADWRVTAFLPHSGNIVGYAFYSRILKQLAQRYFHAEIIVDPCNNPCGQQRMSAEAEEIMMPANAFHSQYVFPNI